MIKANAAAILTAALFLTSAAGSATAAAGELVDLVPAAAPVVIVAKNLPAMAEKLQSFAGITGDGGPSAQPQKGAIGDLLAFLGISSIPEGLDTGGEVLVSMPQFPFPLLAVTVTDYDLFLQSLRSLQGPDAQAPPAVMAGIDAITLSGKPLFARREGTRALLSPTPMLLMPPAPGTGLGALLSAEEKDVLSGSDIFLRLDMGMIMALADPFLRQGIARLGAASDEGGAAPDVAKMLEAEYNLLLSGLRQVRSFVLGASAGGDALTVSSAFLPLPGTPFETLLAKLRSGKPAFLSYFDGDAAMAGTFRFDREAMGGMIRSISGFMFDSGIYSLEPGDREAWDRLVEEGLAAAGANSAWYFGPSEEGNFSAIVVSEVRDTAKFRALLKDSLALSEKLLTSTPGSENARIEFREAAAKHGGVEIDLFRMILPGPEGEEGEQYRKEMKALFGDDSVNVWTAFFDGYMAASYYTATSDELGVMIDRIRKGGSGGFAGSEAFLDATRGLPGENTSLLFFSMPRFLTVIAGMMNAIDPGQPPPPEIARPSGIGVSYRGTGKAMRVDARIPGREIGNIREVVDYLRSLEEKDQSPSPGEPTSF